MNDVRPKTYTFRLFPCSSDFGVPPWHIGAQERRACGLHWHESLVETLRLAFVFSELNPETLLGVRNSLHGSCGNLELRTAKGADSDVRRNSFEQEKSQLYRLKFQPEAVKITKEFEEQGLVSALRVLSRWNHEHTKQSQVVVSRLCCLSRKCTPNLWPGDHGHDFWECSRCPGRDGGRRDRNRAEG